MKGPIQCPVCPVTLQPLETTTSYVEKAILHAVEHGVPVPPQQPAAITMLALCAHHLTVHPEADLIGYLEAYLNS